MKGRDTKGGKHHSAQATQTQGKNIETQKPKETESRRKAKRQG